METDASGLRSTSQSPFTVDRPTRKPVNEPGPETTTKPSTSVLLRLFCWSASAIRGSNCAEYVPPSREVSCRTSKLSPSPRHSAMLPLRPEVSTETISISEAHRSVFHQFQQHASRAGRVNENVEMSARANLDLVRDQARSRGF